MTVDPVPTIAIAIATYRRPQSLHKLLGSLELLTPIAGNVMVIVVDNDVNRSAESLVVEHNEGFPFLIRYACEPRRGIAAVRNRLVREAMRANADFIAFVDDDQWVDPAWLSQLLETRRKSGASIVAGPVISVFEEPAPAWIVNGRFFERRRYPSGSPIDLFGAGNVLIEIDLLRRISGPFDERLGLLGGEDTMLAFRALQLGAHAVWCDLALSFENVPSSRATARWLFNRAYRSSAIYYRCRSEVKGGSNQATRDIVRSLRRTAFGLIRFAISIPLGKDKMMHGLLHVAAGLGGAAQTLGRFKYQEYETIHGQ